MLLATILLNCDYLLWYVFGLPPAPYPMCHMDRRDSEEAHSTPLLGVSGRPGHTGYLVNSSNLLKATMAPILWHSGEKPLSMKSSVLCRSRSGLVMLMGTAILQGDRERGLGCCLQTWPQSCSCPGTLGESALELSLKGGIKLEVAGTKSSASE